MTDPATDPALRALAKAAARTSDAAAELRASVAALWLSTRVARDAGTSVGSIGKGLVRGLRSARRHRARALIRPSVRLAAHSEEVLTAAAACGFSAGRIFGSCARGEDTLASDVDLLVTISEHTSLLDFVRFTDAVENLLALDPGRVDLLDDDALRPGSASGERIAAEMQPLASWAASQRVQSRVR